MSSFVEIPLATKTDLPQDTGWRNIAMVLDPAVWTITSARLRRQGSLVTFTAQITPLETTGSYTFLFYIPVGFRLTQTYAWLNPISATNVLTTWRDTHRLSVEGSVANSTTLRIQSSWTTSDNFPTTLPGTPA